MTDKKTAEVSFADWVSNQAYVPRNLIVVVTGYNSDMPSQLRAAIQAIFERHLRKLTGLDPSKHIANDEGILKLITTTQLPTIEVVERLGKPIQNVLEKWAEGYIHGKTEEELREDGVDLIIIEPDLTHTKAICAWKINGVIPTSTGGSDSVRDISVVPEPLVYSITLDGTVEYGTPEILEEAQKVLDELSAINKNPYIVSDADTYGLFFEPTMSLWDLAKLKFKRWVNANL